MRRALSPTIRPTLLLGALLAAGCSLSSEGGSVSRQLGISQDSPDEFLIVARDPIEIPPNFTLPTPQPGAPSRVGEDPRATAEAVLLNRNEPDAAAPSAAERALLRGANAGDADGAIRQTLAEERVDPEGDRSFGLTSLFGYPIPANLGEGDRVLQSREETERLRQEGLRAPTAPPTEDDDG